MSKVQYRDKPSVIAIIGTVLVLLLAAGDFNIAALYVGLTAVALIVSARRNTYKGVNHRTVFVLGLAGLIVAFATGCLVTMALAATVILSGFAVMWRGDAAPGPTYRRTGLVA